MALVGLGSLSYYANSKAPVPVPGQKPVLTQLQLGISSGSAFLMLAGAGWLSYLAATTDGNRRTVYVMTAIFLLLLGGMGCFGTWYGIRNNRQALGRSFP